MKKGRKVNLKEAERIQEYINKGLSYGEIGKILGRNRSNVYKTLNRYKTYKVLCNYPQP